MKTIETKRDEVRFLTSDPTEMLNKYLASDVLQKWDEDFADEQTGEVITVERHQKLFDKGRLIDQDLLAQINFHIQAGDIKEVDVSSQQRMAFELKSTALYPWQIHAEIGDKKFKFLLYASGISNALEIINDYIELNYSSGYSLVLAKEIDDCIILTDNLNSQKKNDTELDIAYIKDEITTEEYLEAIVEDKCEEVKEKKFYQLEVKVTYDDDVEGTQNFVVHTIDTDRALTIIALYLKELEEKHRKRFEDNGSDYEIRDFKLCIEKAAPMPVGAFIPKEFSMAYNEE